MSPELALERIAQNRANVELFETRERLTRTREQYFRAFELQKDAENIVIIPGGRDITAIAQDIWTSVTSLLSDA